MIFLNNEILERLLIFTEKKEVIILNKMLFKKTNSVSFTDT